MELNSMMDGVQQTFEWPDYLSFCTMLVLSALIGIYFGFWGKKGDGTREYSQGGNDMSIWPITASLAVRLFGPKSKMNLLPQCSVLSILMYVLAADTHDHLLPTHPEHCATDKDSLFKFSVVSRKNQSGNWIAEVHFEHGSEDSEPWEAEVYHVSSKCAGRDKLSIQATLTSPDRENKRRRRDYELIPDVGYYKMHLESRPWLDALETCAKEDAKLLILESESQVRGLMPFFSKHPKNLRDWRNNVFYIGIHDFFADGVYYTISGDPVASLAYNKWSSEPTDPSERCGMLLLDGTLGDANCQEHKLYFICEQDL